MSDLREGQRRPWLIAGLAAIAAMSAVATGLSIGNAQAPSSPPTAGWLRKLPPDQQIDAIDRQLRGFDMAMVEVGYRYTEMYFGAMEGNWEYALYTGEKMGWAIQNGFERRPRRRANAEEIFFKEAYPQVLDAIRKKDIALFKERVDALRHACNACHTAEKVPFIHVGIPTIKQTPLVNN